MNVNTRNETLKTLQKYGQRTQTMTSALDGMKYVGKIKLIKRQDNEEEEQNITDSSTSQQKDLSLEFGYRNQMDDSVADRLNMFKDAERTHLVHKEEERQKADKKLLQRQLTHEERRKQKQNQHPESKDDVTEHSEPEYIRREREMMEEVDKIFQQHKNGSIRSPADVVTMTAITASSSSSSLHDENNNNSRPQSDDSGMVDEEHVIPDEACVVEKEREILGQTEEMFQKFSLQHKQHSTKATAKKNTKTTLKENTKTQSASLPSSFRKQSDVNVQKTATVTDAKHGLLVRLELAEKRAAFAKESAHLFKQNGRLGDALDAEETYHSTALEISKLKKKILLAESSSSSSRACSTVTHGSLGKQLSCEGHSGPVSVVSRECKIPLSMREQPKPVDKSLYNDEGDCVPEGITDQRIKAFQR